MISQSAGRSSRSAAIASVIVIMLSTCLHAQQLDIRRYQSEEDIWEALSEGEISFDDFLELLDLARLGADTLSIPASDWEQLPGAEAGYLVRPDSTLPLLEQADETRSARRATSPSWSVRGGVDANLDGSSTSEGFSVIRFKRGRVRGLLDYAQDGDDGEWRRRTLTYNDPLFRVQLGSIEPRWGRGLVVGRRSRVFAPSELSGELLHPTRNRFDGIWLQAGEGRTFRGQTVVSSISNEEFADRMLALSGTWEHKSLICGLSGLVGEINHDDSAEAYRESVVGAHVQYGNSSRSAIAEVAVSDDGSSAKAVEAVLPLARGRFHARAWSYGVGFLNPWGGGPGHSDTRTIVLDEIGEPYASRVAGERGFDFTTRIEASRRIDLRWDWMSHREEPGAPMEHAGVLRAQMHGSGWSFTPFVRGRVNEDATESFSAGSRMTAESTSREFDLRLEMGTHRVNEATFVRAGIGVKFHLNRVVRIAPTIRWTDPDIHESGDGYWFLYFTETFIPVGNARVAALLVWKKHESSTADDLVELRTRFFVR